MSLIVKLRRAAGPFWGSLKRVAWSILWLRLPIDPLGRPLFAIVSALHVGVREAGYSLLRLFLLEPLFRGQCLSVGNALLIKRFPQIDGRGWKQAPGLLIGDSSSLSCVRGMMVHKFEE
jgi:hypothetical protein